MKLRKPVETTKDPYVQVLVGLQHVTQRSAGSVPFSSGQLRSMRAMLNPSLLPTICVGFHLL